MVEQVAVRLTQEFEACKSINLDSHHLEYMENRRIFQGVAATTIVVLALIKELNSTSMALRNEEFTLFL